MVVELKREKSLTLNFRQERFKAFQLDTRTELRNGKICSQSFKENKCHRVSAVYKCATRTLFTPNAFIAPNSKESRTEDFITRLFQ